MREVAAKPGLSSESRGGKGLAGFGGALRVCRVWGRGKGKGSLGLSCFKKPLCRVSAQFRLPVSEGATGARTARPRPGVQRQEQREAVLHALLLLGRLVPEAQHSEE